MQACHETRHTDTHALNRERMKGPAAPSERMGVASRTGTIVVGNRSTKND